MELTKVLIADPSEEFCGIMSAALEGKYRVRACGDGMQALELIHSFQPDILILDMLLPELDGITLLHKAVQQGRTPAVLGVVRYASDYVIHAAQKLGVGYMMMKPCRTEAVLSRIEDLAEGLRPAQFSNPEPRSQVSNALLQLGFSTKLRGYGYLREAVLMMAKDPRQMLTKEVYPVIGAQCGANGQQVERAIRTAIQSAWKKGPEENWQVYFSEAEQMLDRPTNATLISRLADELLLAAGE